jgi:lipid-binding SYLF domain-containing protein
MTVWNPGGSVNSGWYSTAARSSITQGAAGVPGLSAGISLQGSAIRQDRDSNEDFYGRRLRTRDVVLDGTALTAELPDAAQLWRDALGQHAPSR